MESVFLTIINMSITASWLVLTVILLRLLLKKAPKWIMGVLWGFVAIRLIVPFSLESIFSLIPSAEPIPQNIFTAESPAISSGFPVLNEMINPILSDSLTPNAADSVNPVQSVMFIASVVWIIGIVGMLLYTLISYLRIHSKVREAVPLKENIWICDHISTPFILGIFRPRIYLPSSMNEADTDFVVSHEKAHLKRKDHIWKPFGFLLLTVYWFNPLLWVAYILLCKDIELACDEKVLRELGTEMKKPYSNALINCSVPHKMISACPLSFGETGVKERVKGVLSYKKPAFWVIIAAVLTCIVTAVCLLTNPVSNTLGSIEVLSLETTIQNTENFVVSNPAHQYSVGKISEELAEELCNIKISKKEISLNRGIDRDRTNTLMLQTMEDTEVRAGVTCIHFNYDFTSVWVDNNVKPTLSYAVINPKKAKKVFNDIANYNTEQQSVTAEAVYQYKSDKDTATLNLSAEDKACSFSFSILSSYFSVGTYEETNESLVMKSNDGKNKYTFRKEDGKLIFVAAQSSEMPKYSYSSGANAEVCVPDGAVFERVSISTIGGADQPTEIQVGSNPYFNAEVIEVGNNNIVVKPDEESNEIKSADKISVSLDVISTIPVPTFKIGDRVRVVYNGEIAETYPAQINNVFAIYLLNEDGVVLSPTPLN